jgi:long-subunit acyl-CoA synthetase (AMP-forming)
MPGHHHDRCKNLIVTHGGNNVYPEELEMYLKILPIFLSIPLVLGKPISADNRGEEVVAYIVPDYEYIEDTQHAGGKTIRLQDRGVDREGSGRPSTSKFSPVTNGVK